MMRSIQPAALVVGLATFCATLAAQADAQEFRIEEVSSPAGLAVEQLKPKAIAFVDRPSEELVDPDAGLIRFEDWAQARPVEKQFLTPFPSYLEPTVEVTVDGVRKRFKEKLHMYVGEARFALARPPGSIDLASFVTLPFVERIDSAIKHRLITSAEAVSPKDPRAMHNQHPLRRWCETRPVTICIRSRYQFEGKLLAVFQRHPTDANQTIVTVFMVLAVESSIMGKKKEFAKIPVLRNLVPAQVLAGKSSFNTGNSISAGLPVYARNQAKAMAAILERK
jgi:hypothetical protein